MHELSWWYLYIQIINARAERKKETYEIIEALLPWINPELYAEAKKQEGQVRENVDFDDQFRAMLDGTWNSDPDAQQVPFIDDIQVGGEGLGQPVSVSQLFDQQEDQPQAQPGSIRETIFPGVPPSFKGVMEGSPEDVAEQFDAQVPIQPSDEVPVLRPMVNPKRTQSAIEPTEEEE